MRIGRILRDTGGASAAEYAMILAIVGAAIAVAALQLGDAVSSSLDNKADQIANCGDGSC